MTTHHLLKTLSRASAILAGPSDLNSGLQEALSIVGMELGWACGGFWLFSGPSLKPRATWAAEGAALPEDWALKVFPPVWVPPEKWPQDAPIWHRSIKECDPCVLESDFARETRLSTAVLVSVGYNLQCIGTLAFFSMEELEPEPTIMWTLSALGHVLAQFVLRTRSETGRILAETERDRLSEVLDMGGDYVWIADAAGNVIYDNHAMRALHPNIPPLVGRGIRELHPTWAANKILEEGLPSAIKRGTWQGETAFLGPDGHEIPTHQTISAYRGPDHDLLFFATVARDISKQKRVERSHRDIVKRLKDLHFAIESSTIYDVTDTSGIITEVNHNFCEVSGYGQEELVGSPHRILNSGHHPKAFFEDLWGTILAGKIWRGEIRNKRKDGTFYWVETTIVPILDTEGMPHRFMALRSVVTKRKAAEEALLRRDHQLELLVAASRELNQDLDIQTVMRRLVETGCRLIGGISGTYGIRDEEHIRVPEFFQAESWSPMNRTYTKGEGVPGAIMDALYPVLVTDAKRDPRVSKEIQEARDLHNILAVPIKGRNGHLHGFFAVHDKIGGLFGEEDISMMETLATHAAVAIENAALIETRAREEETLRHTQKLESLGLLAGGIAHDFNNLLAAILGNLNLAMVNEEAATYKYLVNIENAVKRAASLTRQMLTYAGQGRPQAEELNLNTMVGEIAGLLGASIHKKIRLELHLQDALPLLVADPAQIEQVVMNLVTNAADAIGDKEGAIVISTSLQPLSASEIQDHFFGQKLTPGQFLALEVTDSGCGIPQEILGRIFDPFFSTKGFGRGLGLSAMQGILRSHGCGYRIFSDPGVGTTFQVYFPASTRVETQPAQKEDVEFQAHGAVLVVDDDPTLRETIGSMMESMGFTVFDARDGQEAVNIFTAWQHAITLVFMDLSMPNMDGMEAMEIIRSIKPSTKIILNSGYNAPSASSPETPDAFMRKPWAFKDLRRTIHEVLSPTTQKA